MRHPTQSHTFIEKPAPESLTPDERGIIDVMYRTDPKRHRMAFQEYWDQLTVQQVNLIFAQAELVGELDYSGPSRFTAEPESGG